jgi:hypothetical protein
MASVFNVYGIAYDFEDAETDEGSEPVFSSWVDVATYVDKNLL